MKDFLKRFRSPSIWLAVISVAWLAFSAFTGTDTLPASEATANLLNSVCSVLTLMGVMSDPTKESVIMKKIHRKKENDCKPKDGEDDDS